MDMQKIGSFLAELRKEKNLTQDELGAQIGVTNKTISRWETKLSTARRNAANSWRQFRCKHKRNIERRKDKRRKL